MPRKVLFQCNLTPEQYARLRALSEQTKVPIAEWVRQGIDLVLAREEAGRGVISTDGGHDDG